MTKPLTDEQLQEFADESTRFGDWRWGETIKALLREVERLKRENALCEQDCKSKADDVLTFSKECERLRAELLRMRTLDWGGVAWERLDRAAKLDKILAAIRAFGKEKE